jgi:hypothetical protein
MDVGERVQGRRKGAVRLARSASSCALALIRALAPSASISSEAASAKGCPFRPSFLTALLALHGRLCVEQESFALCLGGGGDGGKGEDLGYRYLEDDVIQARCDIHPLVHSSDHIISQYLILWALSPLLGLFPQGRCCSNSRNVDPRLLVPFPPPPPHHLWLQGGSCFRQ